MPLIHLLGGAAVALTGGGLWAGSEGVKNIGDTAIKLAVVGAVIFVGGKALKVF